LGRAGKACRTIHERRAPRTEIATDKRYVALSAIDLALIGDHAELAVAGLDAGFSGADDVALMAQAVPDQLRHGQHLEPILPAELDQVGYPGHFPVVAHDLADHTRRVEPGEPRQVDRRFGLSGAHKYPPATRSERKDVPRPRQIGGGRPRVDCSADG